MFRWDQAIRFPMDEQRGATDIRNDPADHRGFVGLAMSGGGFDPVS